jgi:hypothetical protein
VNRLYCEDNGRSLIDDTLRVFAIGVGDESGTDGISKTGMSDRARNRQAVRRALEELGDIPSGHLAYLRDKRCSNGRKLTFASVGDCREVASPKRR